MFRQLALALICLIAAANMADARRTAFGSETEIKRLLVREANRSQHVPPSLALAVAQAESNFNPDAESHAGARGVMQIMPATGRGD